MNIIVLTSEGNVTTRPDTTWEKDNEDFYVPEDIHSIKFAPVLFARISKPGRSIEEKFASRHYDAIGYGVFLYPSEYLDIPRQGWACANCLDHTSFLPHPLFNPATLSLKTNSFELKKNGRSIFLHPADTVESVEQAVSKVSTRCYLRTGDFVVKELSAPKDLCTSAEKEVQIRGTYCDNETIDFKIIF